MTTTPGTVTMIGHVDNVNTVGETTQLTISINSSELADVEKLGGLVTLQLTVARARVDQAAAQTETTEGFRA
jgi:hypothetical protein